MHPILFTLWGRPIHVYGLMAALGLIAAMIHWSWLGRRQNRPAGLGADLAIWMTVGGLLGARAAYVIAHWTYFASNLWEIPRIDHGGLIYYGGLLGGTAGCLLLVRSRGMKLWEIGDFACTGLPLAQAFGRIGCFFNGCCYGQETSFKLSVFAEGAQRHPVQLYESAICLAIYAALLAHTARKRPPGTTLALYLVLYPPARFLLEFLRGDSRMMGPGLNAAQIVSLVLLAVGAGLWLLHGKKRPCRNES